MIEEDKKNHQVARDQPGIRYENEFKVTLDCDGKQCYERNYVNITTRNLSSTNGGR